MDDESIWQQLELSNEENFQLSIKSVAKFLAASTDKFKLNLDDMIGSESEQGEIEEGSIDLGEADEEEDEDSKQEIEEDEITEQENKDDEVNEQENEEDEVSEQENEDNSEKEFHDRTEHMQPKQKKGLKKSIVDDQFFKLSEMEEFLQREDRREMNPGADDEDNLEVDLFIADGTNREESLKYSDFYEEDDEDEDESRDDDENFAKPEEPKSSHELMQERLQKKIDYMENAMLDNRPWQMKGEVKADNRPQNSLLEEVLEFDSTTRPAPIITEEVTMRLEDIIKQRIKDKAFDDVERKVKPSDIRIEYKKQLVLDQEKSKQSLAQIYEKEFIKEIEKNKNDGDEDEPEETKEQKEIRADIKDLFEKLDMMSNFFFTPRTAQPDLKIITNLPTITIEEVAPVSVSDAAMLAPEEIKRKPKGEIIGKGERSKTDKNRERRHKKVHQKQKHQKQPIDKKSLAEKVTKSRNVEKVKPLFLRFQL